MMRDALALAEGGLIRSSPAPADTVGDFGDRLPRPMKASMTFCYKRATVKERKDKGRRRVWIPETPKARWFRWTSSGGRASRILSISKDLDTDEQRIRELRGSGEREDTAWERPVLDIGQEFEEQCDRNDEDAVAKELALDEREWNDEHGRDEFVIPVVHRGLDVRTSHSVRCWKIRRLQKVLLRRLGRSRHAARRRSPRAMVAVAILALKINRVAVEHRQEAASACWHALQCINQYLRASRRYRGAVMWIERDRFVVIHIKDSEELKATGRIVKRAEMADTALLFQAFEV